VAVSIIQLDLDTSQPEVEEVIEPLTLEACEDRMALPTNVSKPTGLSRNGIRDSTPNFRVLAARSGIVS